MTRSDFLRTLGLAAAGLAWPARTRAASGEHAGHGTPGASAATEGYIAASDRMHRDMAIAFTGDPDVDFARAMIPHHQGAIDMATVLLAYGQDPELRALAEQVVAAQTAEIAVLTAWLERNPA